MISNARSTPSIAPVSGLTDKSLIADAPNWKIDLIVDKEDKTLTITDNGIGMNEEDFDKNLGVIANSGTKAFAQALEGEAANQYPELIGQFGVGFTSCSMVAESVTRITPKRGEGERRSSGHRQRHRQLHAGGGARQPGTTIVLKLREAWRSS